MNGTIDVDGCYERFLSDVSLMLERPSDYTFDKYLFAAKAALGYGDQITAMALIIQGLQNRDNS